MVLPIPVCVTECPPAHSSSPTWPCFQDATKSTGCNSQVLLSEMERTGSELSKVVIRKSVLSPLPIGGFTIEPDIRMNRHAVKRKHSSVYSMSNFGCNGLGCHQVDEQMPRLEDQGHSRSKVPAPPVLIGWRTSNDEHLTGLEGEFPKRIFRRTVLRTRIVLMKVLQCLPESRDKLGVFLQAWVRLKQRRHAGPSMSLRSDERNKALHISYQFIEIAPGNERVEHLSAGLSRLTEKAGVVRVTKLFSVPTVCLGSPVVF